MNHKKIVVEVYQEGIHFDVMAKYLKDDIWTEEKRLSLKEFHSLGEVAHYLQHVPLVTGEVFTNVLLYTSETEYNQKQWSELYRELVKSGRGIEPGYEV